jgi:uncharacterized RDD family membrane protein YckC
MITAQPGSQTQVLAAGPGSQTEALSSLPHADGESPHDGTPAVYVGLVTRALAIVLDALVIDVVALAVTGAVLVVRSALNITGKHHKVDAVVAAVVFGAWVVAYFVVFWSTTGQTPGNRIMHIRVVRSDGERVRPTHAVIRLGAMILSLPLFWGYLPILTSARRRGFPDAVAGTVVVVSDGPR